MHSLGDTSLTPDERALLERFGAIATERLGRSLQPVWLFGSRARGEAPAHEDSDVDVRVLVDDDSWAGKDPVYDALQHAARELDLTHLTPWFALYVPTPAWLAGRREIKSFFVAEADRDKVVIEGSA